MAGSFPARRDQAATDRQPPVIASASPLAATQGRLSGWAVALVMFSGLVLAMLLLTGFAIVQNQRVKDVAVVALRQYVALANKGDDIVIATSRVRDAHQRVVVERSPSTISDFDGDFDLLRQQVDDYGRLDLAGADAPSPDRLEELVDGYYAEFRPAVSEAVSDSIAFSQQNAVGLQRLAEIERIGRDIGAAGATAEAAALADITKVAATERNALLALLVGAMLIGVALAASSARVLARVRAAYAGEHAARRELAEALRTKTDFLADASHELRTPLAVIRGNADLGLAADNKDAIRRSLADIVAEADRMAKLVDDLLFLARSDAGVLPLEREFVPVRWLVGGLTQHARALARSRGGCLRVEVAVEGFLHADPDRCTQAGLILVDNALRHSPAGAFVSLEATTFNGFLEIVVADLGPGIPPADLPLIFDRFYQVGKRRARMEGGHGLGLSIARSIADAHGGALAAASELGVGTRMTLRLPIARSIAPDEAA